MKTRPPKKNPRLLANLLDLIRRGRTITDACRIYGISTTTFNRWRDKDLQFNKDVILATQEQWRYIGDTKSERNRVYKRKAIISQTYDQNAFKSPQNKPQSLLNDRPNIIDGLPVRYGNIYDDKPYIPCITPDGIYVEFLETKGELLMHRRYYATDWKKGYF